MAVFAPAGSRLFAQTRRADTVADVELANLNNAIVVAWIVVTAGELACRFAKTPSPRLRQTGAVLGWLSIGLLIVMLVRRWG